jgi:hypothetical protein
MKMPRDLLFEHHREVQPKLDALRSEVVARLRQEKPFAAPAPDLVRPVNFWVLLWRELILPSRQVWAGIAAVWVLILAVNLALRDPAPAGKTMVSAPTMMSFQEQQQLVNELLADRAQPHDADRPKTVQPGPRSMRSVMVTT